MCGESRGRFACKIGSKLPRKLHLCSKNPICVVKILESENPGKRLFLGAFLASPARFERAAFRLGGERSILLSYGEIYNRYIICSEGIFVK